MKRILILFLILAALLARAGGFKFSWFASNDSNVTGYKFYFGTSSRGYTTSIPVGNVTEAEVTGLVDGETYYCAVTALNAAGAESDFSNEVKVKAAPTVKLERSNDFSTVFWSQRFPGYRVEYCDDLVNNVWTLAGPVATRSDGTFSVLDPGTVPQRFYRLKRMP